jgi:ATP adenylyltransferase
MNKIYSPWRHQYITKQNKSANPDGTGCIFCIQINDEPENLLILKKLKHCFIVINIYPYTSGHLLIIPYQHGIEIYGLNSKTTTEIFQAGMKSMEILKVNLQTEGFNLGINVGYAGGSGITDHSHMHIVPRWKGDTNFMASIAETNVICSSISEIFEKLLPIFQSTDFDTKKL